MTTDTDEQTDVSATNQSTDPDSDESVTHEITAHEAHWSKSKLRYNPDEIGDVEVVHKETKEAVEGTVFHWEYYCRCGEEFADYDEAREHLREHAESD